MQPRPLDRMPYDKSFRSRRAAELHDLLMKYIHSDQAKSYLNQIEFHLETLQQYPEDLKEKSRVGFTYLADILHLPYVIYRNQKEVARQKALPLFEQFIKWVKTPELIVYFLTQTSLGNHNLLHTVIESEDAVILQRFLNYLTEVTNKTSIIEKETIHSLLKQEDAHGNNALHLIARKNNTADVKYLIDWLKVIFGTGDMFQIVMQNLLNHKNKAGFKPSSKNPDIRQLLGQLRGLDEEQARKQELDQQKQMNYELQIKVEQKGRELEMREGYFLEREQFLLDHNEYLQSRLARNEHDLEWHQRELRSLQFALQEVQKELAVTRQERRAHYEQMQYQQQTLLAEIRGLQGNVDEIREERNKLQVAYQTADHKARQALHSQEALDKSLGEVKHENQALQVALATAQARVKELEAALAAAKAKKHETHHSHHHHKTTHKSDKDKKDKKDKRDKRDLSPERRAHSSGGAGMWRSEARAKDQEGSVHKKEHKQR